VRGGKLSAELVVLKKAQPPNGKGSQQLWVLDENGASMTSKVWASALDQAAVSGVRRIILFVGPADGVPKNLRATSDRVISMGSATMPSWLACLVAAEQVYRADTILRGTPYHNG
jgi:23S rRNA (pseudouridine1915-N3)-methyltransferase